MCALRFLATLFLFEIEVDAEDIEGEARRPLEGANEEEEVETRRTGEREGGGIGGSGSILL